MGESLIPEMTGNLERARGAFVRRRVEICAALILLLMAVNLVSVTARKSITTDEVVLIPSAYYHLVTNHVQLIPQHPPLCKLLAGLPLLFIQPNELPPTQIDPSARPPEVEWAYITRLWQDNRAHFEAICFWARVPMIGLTLALGVLLFAFARELFGDLAALLALFLFALEPTVLAHGRVVQTDIPAAFGFLLTVVVLYRYLRGPTRKLALGVGAAAGIAMLAKYSMVVLGPLLLVVFLVLLWRRKDHRPAIAGHALLALLALVGVINAGYFFHHRSFTAADAQWIANCFPAANELVSASVRILRLILPTDFVMGVYWQLHHSHEGHPAGLLGMHSTHGWWYYFPAAFALKATIPFLLLSLASSVWCVARIIRGKEWPLLILLIPFALYTALLMASPLNIGVRYYLPGYVFLLILSGAFLNALFARAKSKPARISAIAVAAVALAWISFETLRAYPHYMPYMNQLASARAHWWYLSDSNVEWGDDARELAEYLRARGETRVRAMLLGGFATLDAYGVNYQDALAPNTDPPPRYTALGASFLNGSTVPSYEVQGQRVPDEVRINTFRSYRRRAPEAVIGNSIYVYRNYD
jgi:4-amino-4-deoxy-L-arabinose transferase-like glycosyltransferase